MAWLCTAAAPRKGWPSVVCVAVGLDPPPGLPWQVCPRGLRPSASEGAPGKRTVPPRWLFSSGRSGLPHPVAVEWLLSLREARPRARGAEAAGGWPLPTAPFFGDCDYL